MVEDATSWWFGLFTRDLAVCEMYLTRQQCRLDVDISSTKLMAADYARAAVCITHAIGKLVKKKK